MSNDKIDYVYDEDIHPLVERIALVCKQYQLPMFMSIQESPTSIRTTCLNSKESRKIQELYLMNQSWDFDQFMAKMIDIAKVHGHDSKYMAAMGIPEKPKKS